MKFKTNPFAVPSLAEASPHYADQVQRRDDMQAKLAKAEQECTTLRARLDTSRVTATDGAKAARVAALIGDGIAPDGDHALSELDRTIGDLKSALVEMNKRVAAARVVASTAVCERIAPEHQQRAGAICTKLIELDAANADYTALADAINAHDVIWQALIPAHPLFLGRPNDPNGPIADYLRLAVQEGNVSSTQIPMELRHA
jgi:hypothetical protein